MQSLPLACPASVKYCTMTGSATGPFLILMFSSTLAPSSSKTVYETLAKPTVAATKQNANET